MSSVIAWLITGWIHILVGFLIGWVFFKQPGWIMRRLAALWAWIKTKLHIGNTTPTTGA